MDNQIKNVSDRIRDGTGGDSSDYSERRNAADSRSRFNRNSEFYARHLARKRRRFSKNGNQNNPENAGRNTPVRGPVNTVDGTEIAPTARGKHLQRKNSRYRRRLEKTNHQLEKRKNPKETSMKAELAEEGMQVIVRRQTDDMDDNVSLDAIMQAADTAEAVSTAKEKHYLTKTERMEKKASSLYEKQLKSEAELTVNHYFETDPSVQQTRGLQKKAQRDRMMRTYTKAIQEGQSREAAYAAAKASAGNGGFLSDLKERLLEGFRDHSGGTVLLFIVLGALLLLMTSVSAVGTVANGMITATMSAAYLSEPADLDEAELRFTELEMNLQNEIDSIESDYPGYDEYDYDLAEIGHNPFTLLNYLSAKYETFTYDQVKGEVESLYNNMYSLVKTPVTETRTREVQATDEDGNPLYDADGNPVMTTEEYQVRILRVTLTSGSLDLMVSNLMTDEQKETYNTYQDSKGLLQIFASPVDYYWYNYVLSYWGYRKNPSTQQSEMHEGLDIAIPAGSKIYAGMDGTATTGYDSYYGNYVTIQNSDGYTVKYAHMSSLSISNGATVTSGQQIGLSGSSGTSTGSELHFECLYNGTYYNPLLYFDTGTETIYGESATGTGGGSFGTGTTIAPDAYDDPTVQRLMEEAAKYVGYPYVWGGSSPSTSFDCSGFVCWVFKNSGVYPLSRTSAQGIYDQCVKISPSQAKAGDIIFFTGTYKSAGPVSHVGIYCGDGIMVHAGNPIKYSSINTSYWQNHFYAFGRLSQ